MWRLMICSLALVACTETPEPSGITATSHVATYDTPGGYAPQLDLLIVIDDTTAMAPYAERVAMLPDLIETALRPEYDLRVAVTTNGGALRAPAGSPDPFLATRLGFDLARASSFDRSLADALRPLTSVGAASAGGSQPLAAVRAALDGNPGGFLREDAALGIVIVTASDDASPDAVSDYATWIEERKASAYDVMVSVIHVNDSPRLDSFLTLLSAPESVDVPLDSGDPSAAFTAFEAAIRSIIPGICWIASDLDPETAGAQYDCTVSADVDGRELLLRPCSGEQDDDPLCWRLVPSGPECSGDTDGFLEPRIAAYHFFSFVPPLHAQCVVLDAE